MSNDDVNAVILRLARTLQRCGEDPRAVFAALVGAAATIAPDCGVAADRPDDLLRAVDSVVAHGDLRGFPAAAPARAEVIPFHYFRVA